MLRPQILTETLLIQEDGSKYNIKHHYQWEQMAFKFVQNICNEQAYIQYNH